MLDPQYTSDVQDSGQTSSEVTFNSLPPPRTVDSAIGASTTFSLSGATGFSFSPADYVTGTGRSVSGTAIYFQPTDSTTTYALSGSYSFYSQFPTTDITLTDLTTQATVGSYQSNASGSSAYSGTFTVGDTNGTTTGSLSGTLNPSDVYELQYEVAVDSSSLNGGADGSGTLGISFSDASPVPEPVSVLLFAPAAIAICIRRRHQM
jgi:hypothetical protein